MIKLALASLRSRLFPVILVLIALTASMALLLSIDRIQVATKNGFNQSISGVDLLLGPRSGDIELVLYTVFHLGKPTNNITYKTLEELSKLPEIDWVVPLALGDSHQGYRVVATTPEYFSKVKFASTRSLTFDQGVSFSAVNQVVVGREVADALDYHVGDSIFLAHGSGGKLGKIHDDFSFKISGILAPTGTPIDQAVFVGLNGYELIHLGWESGRKLFGVDSIELESLPDGALKPKTLTAAYIGLKSKMTLFKVAREISSYPEEAVSAVIPSLALADLWSIVGMVDQVFGVISWMIIAISIIGMVTMTITSLEARTREMTILRANGAPPTFLAGLVITESLLIGLGAILAAILLVTLTTLLAQDYLITHLGIAPEIQWINTTEIATVAIILCAGVVSSLLPATMVFFRSLRSGLLK